MEHSTIYDAKQQMWFGPQRKVKFDKAISIGEHFYESMQRNSDKICQTTHPEGTVLTYKEVLEFSIRIAQYLRGFDLSKDDVVGVIAKTSTMSLPIALGCWFNAVPFYPIHTQYGKDFISRVFGLVRPKVIFCDVDELNDLEAACKVITIAPKVVVIGKCIKDITNLADITELKSNTDDFLPSKLVDGPTQTSLYLSSTGLTGFPKCMHISNEYLLEDVSTLPSNCVIFNSSNLNWITGINNLCTTLLSGCTRIISTLPVDADVFFGVISRYKTTHLYISTTLCAQAVKRFDEKLHDLSSIQYLSCAGSMLSQTVYQQARKMLPNGLVGNLYGLTECNSTTLNTKHEKPTAVGQLLPGFRAKIIDETGHNLGVDAIGEILLHNGRCWKGYVGNSEETAIMQDADGWFHTGDLGYFDKDADLFVVDRKKEALHFRFRVYLPCDIEKVIVELSDVIEVCVFGIRDDVDEDRAAAAVTLRSGSKLRQLDIQEYVANKLPYHMNLHGGVYIVENFPRAHNGKILRREMRDLIILKKGLESNLLNEIK